MKFSDSLHSPPDTYPYVREVNLGSTRKFIEIYLLFKCFPTKSLWYLRGAWMGSRNLSKTVKESSSSPRAAGVYSTLFYQSRISKISVLASTRENGIPHFLHTCGTIYCWETGVHISAFNKALLQLKLHGACDYFLELDLIWDFEMRLWDDTTWDQSHLGPPLCKNPGISMYLHRCTY